MNNPKIALFIPTYNAILSCGQQFVQLLTIIQHSCLNQVLIIDSSSLDNTTQVVSSFGFDLQIIKKESFDHSATRQKACEILRQNNDIIIAMTQDVLLNSSDAINNLIQPLLENDRIAAVYGRQLPHTNADLFAQHLRRFNYPDKSHIRTYNDRYIYGIKCAFASNAFAAYRTQAIYKVGGFSERLILGEDMYMFAKLLENKYSVAYVANAVCYHSHNYSIKDDFKRYFDIGVFHRTEGWILTDFGYPNKQGIKYAISELKFLGYRVWLWPKSFIKLLAKYVGYKLGYHFDIIGVILCRKFSFNRGFWW